MASDQRPGLRYCGRDWLVLPYEQMRTISLKLPEDLLAELEREAKARRMSKSTLVRESVE
jgi:hypothetical protein